MSAESNLPAPAKGKPGFVQWASEWLGIPFTVPSLALPQTVKNADKAIGRLIAAGLDNVSGRIERNTAIRGGRTEAELEAIKAAAGQFAAKTKTDPYLTERALEYTFGESVLKQKNREQVGRLALEHLNAGAQSEAGAAGGSGADAPTDIEDDWLTAFSDHVGSKSDAEIQSLWAKILANEIRKPRSFSLQSLRLLADMSADDARLIHDNVLPLVVCGEIIFAEGLHDRTNFIKAQELGVVTGASGVGLEWQARLRAGATRFPYSGGNLIVEAAQEMPVSFPSMTLTRFGKELLNLSNDYPRAPDDYIERLCEFIRNKGVLTRNIRAVPASS